AELDGAIGTRGGQAVVDPPQLGVLPGQPPVLLDHVSAWPVVALAAVGLVLADPVAQGFRVHVQLLAQPPKRRARGRLPIQPHRALAQLIGVLLRCCQQCLPSWLSRSNQSWKTPEKRGNLRAGRQAPAGSRSPCPVSARRGSPRAGLGPRWMGCRSGR